MIFSHIQKEQWINLSFIWLLYRWGRWRDIQEIRFKLLVFTEAQRRYHVGISIFKCIKFTGNHNVNPILKNTPTWTDQAIYIQIRRRSGTFGDVWDLDILLTSARSSKQLPTSGWGLPSAVISTASSISPSSFTVSSWMSRMLLKITSTSCNKTTWKGWEFESSVPGRGEGRPPAVMMKKDTVSARCWIYNYLHHPSYYCCCKHLLYLDVCLLIFDWGTVF